MKSLKWFCVIGAVATVILGVMYQKDSKLLRYVMYTLLLAFMVFSVYPPELGIFVSPV